MRRQPKFKFPIEAGSQTAEGRRRAPAASSKAKLERKSVRRGDPATTGVVRSPLPPQLASTRAARPRPRQAWPRRSRHAPPAEAAVGAGEDVLAADRAGEAHDALGDQLRVLDQLVEWLTTPGRSILPSGSLTSFHSFHSCSWRDVGGLERIALRVDLQHEVDDVLERQVVGVRPVPGAPAQVVAHAVFRDALERVVDRVDAQPGRTCCDSPRRWAPASACPTSRPGRGRRSAGRSRR